TAWGHEPCYPPRVVRDRRRLVSSVGDRASRHVSTVSSEAFSSEALVAVVARALALVVTIAIVACGHARLPRPPYVQQPTSALVEAPYPPPPARVEVVPDSPRDEAVWVDGEWTWHGRRWAWRRGRWVVTPSGGAFSPWTTVRNGDGTLYFAEGTWRDA